MSILQFYRSSPDAICPTKGSSGAAGYDLSSAETFVILARDRAKIATGLHIAVPSGYYARIAPRSGLALKYGLDTGAGVIDQDYRGEVAVILFNHTDDNHHIRKGDRIAQLILEKIAENEELQEVRDQQSLGHTQRGEGGFGSTGTGHSLTGQY